MEENRAELLERVNPQENETPVEEPVKEEAVEDTKVDETEDIASIPSPMNSRELKELQQMVKSAVDSFKAMEEMTKTSLEMRDVNFKAIEIIEALLQTNKEDAEGRMKFEYDYVADDDNLLHYELYVSMMDIEQAIGWIGGDDEEADKKEKELFQEVFAIACQYISVRNALVEIQEDYRKHIKEQYDYYTSPAYAKVMEDRLNAMKEQYAKEEDPDVKAKLEKAIAAIEAMNTMEYIFKRLDEISGESATIADIFFDSRRSQYVIDRWMKKAKGLGINPNLFYEFMGIETKFLPETYHPFNNLFLFAMMRNIAHIDLNKKDDVMYARNTLRMMARLMNHAFPTQEVENSFLNVIMKYLDNFMPYRDKFVTDNQSYTAYLDKIRNEKTEDSEETDDGPAIKDSMDIPVTTTMDFDKSIWRGNVSIGERLYVISERITTEGFKLYANGRPIIKPSEVPEEDREYMCLLPAEYDDVSAAYIITCIPNKVVGEMLAERRYVDASGMPDIPFFHSMHTGDDTELIGNLPLELLNETSRGSWESYTADGVVPVFFENGYYFIGHYVVINYNPNMENHSHIWLADKNGIIRTKVTMETFKSLVNKTEEE